MSDLLLGLRLYARGAGTVLRSPRLLRLGALPALATAVLYVGALVVFVRYLGDLVGLLTSFAAAWSPGARDLAEVVVGTALVAAVALVAVLTFVAVTLAIGGPFYEKLSEIVDDTVGSVPDGPGRSWFGSVRDGLLLVALSVLVAIPLFVAGFVPVVGQTVVPVVAALVGGRLLVLELTAPALERRGLGLAARRRVVRSRRLLGWAVGVPTYLLCLIPLVGIVAVPIGAAAATLVARELQGEPTGVPTRPARGEPARH
ncbi:EI24 domain-containing protein [Actinomycetospora soli]|uniref:EI24 domain-containing protein n=1 Tax=Actinomycetospora soli TaxID=2893887 RepID=UPI001E658CED|nr:EI24 domain-containing protein [Actinomycetospora soli]MCD2186362.1 EI24 domain-containing protein [Actinomycetospora soli]